MGLMRDTDVVLKELWLHSICDFEPENVGVVMGLFKNIDNAYESSLKDIEKQGLSALPKRFVQEKANKKHINKAEKLLEYCDKKGIRIITMDSEEYPYYLKNIYLPPRILFAIGKKLDFENNIGVSVVGCRKPTIQGKNIAEKIGYNLAHNGITVVSGMAEGIDAAAHEGALKAKGSTVAVLAGGVEDIYPKSNKGLYHRILENGTIVSERPPATSVKRYFYQQRNRIVVGFSAGLVVVEGKIKSGTSISARLATENNRDIFAVPGNPTVGQAELPNALIADGAAIVDKIEVPMEYYKGLFPDKVKIKENKEKTQEVGKPIKQITDDDRIIIEVLRENGGVAHADVIADGCNLPISRVTARMTILSIKGIVRKESGNRFVLIRDV